MSTPARPRTTRMAVVRFALAASVAALMAACGSSPESIQVINQTEATLTVTTRRASGGPDAGSIVAEPVLIGPGQSQSWVIDRDESLAGPRLDILARPPTGAVGNRYGVALTPPGPYSVTARGGPTIITFDVNRPAGSAGDRQEQRIRRDILNPRQDGPR